VTGEHRERSEARTPSSLACCRGFARALRGEPPLAMRLEAIDLADRGPGSAPRERQAGLPAAMGGPCT
jgi:hypothetical protein